jgi:uncharacterized membrane protein (DUF4010 family)
MFPRVMIEVGVVYSPLLKIISIPMVVMLLASLGGVYLLWRVRKEDEQESREVMEVSNPLRFPTALTFALAFAVVLIVVRAANEFFGSAGVYLASILTGITDVDAITLSVSDLAASGQIDITSATVAILLAALVNTTAKAVIAWMLGSVALRRTIVRVYGFVLFTGIVSGAIILGAGL